MKKTIIFLSIFISLFFTNTYNLVFADVIAPWREKINYDHECIRKCMDETWEPYVICKNGCIENPKKSNEKNTEKKVENKYLLEHKYLFLMWFFLIIFLWALFFVYKKRKK